MFTYYWLAVLLVWRFVLFFFLKGSRGLRGSRGSRDGLCRVVKLWRFTDLMRVWHMGIIGIGIGMNMGIWGMEFLWGSVV